MTMIVESGHGGIDIGAVGYVVEKDINDRFARYLVHCLIGISGGSVDVQFAPDGGNANDDLNTTVAFVNQFPADSLFISVHSNAGGGTGMEVLVQNGYNSGRTRQLAEAVHGGFIDGIRETYPTYKSRGIKEQDLYVLRNTNCDAVLLETGFVDNGEDAGYINNDVAMFITADRTARRILKDFGLWTPEVVAPAPPQIVEPAQPTLPTSTNIAINLGQANVDKLTAGGEVVFTVKK